MNFMFWKQFETELIMESNKRLKRTTFKRKENYWHRNIWCLNLWIKVQNISKIVRQVFGFLQTFAQILFLFFKMPNGTAIGSLEVKKKGFLYQKGHRKFFLMVLKTHENLLAIILIPNFINFDQIKFWICVFQLWVCEGFWTPTFLEW